MNGFSRYLFRSSLFQDYPRLFFQFLVISNLPQCSFPPFPPIANGFPVCLATPSSTKFDIGFVLFLIFYCGTLYTTTLRYWTCIVSVRHSIFQYPFPAACIFAMIHAMLNIWTNFTHVFVKLEILVLGLHSHDDNTILICNFFFCFFIQAPIFSIPS